MTKVKGQGYEGT